MGGGPDNAKDACISELTNYALTLARLSKVWVPVPSGENCGASGPRKAARLAAPA